MIFFFLWLTSLNMIISRTVYIAANGIISFFFIPGATGASPGADTWTAALAGPLFSPDQSFDRGPDHTGQ